AGSTHCAQTCASSVLRLRLLTDRRRPLSSPPCFACRPQQVLAGGRFRSAFHNSLCGHLTVRNASVPIRIGVTVPAREATAPRGVDHYVSASSLQTADSVPILGRLHRLLTAQRRAILRSPLEWSVRTG